MTKYLNLNQVGLSLRALHEAHRAARLGIPVCFTRGTLEIDKLHAMRSGPSRMPAQFSPLIAKGEQHTIALSVSGAVWTFGENCYGQLGTGNVKSRDDYHMLSNEACKQVYRPKRVELERFTHAKVIGIAAGDNHSLIGLDDRTIWAWGDNCSGQLGNGEHGDGRLSANPVQVQLPKADLSPSATLVKLAAGAQFSMAAFSDGSVFFWGTLKLGRAKFFSANPKRIFSLRSAQIVDIVAAANHALIVIRMHDKDSIAVFGNNSHGQLGVSTATHPNIHRPAIIPLPHQISTIHDCKVTAIATGSTHSLVAFSDGTVWGWGDNASGQLTDGYSASNGESCDVPVQVALPHDIRHQNLKVTALAAGEDFSLIVFDDGSVWGCGSNECNQIHVDSGDLESYDARELVHVQFPPRVCITQLAASSENTVAICSQGFVWSWGRELPHSYLPCLTSEELAKEAEEDTFPILRVIMSD